MRQLTDLIDVKKSPLSRIMTVSNSEEPNRRIYENNICATHIGDGFIISVAHNLFSSVPVYRSVSESFYQTEIIEKISQEDAQIMNSKYLLDPLTNKRHANLTDVDIPVVSAIFQNLGKDMRYVGMYKDLICNPFLVFNFDTNEFFTQQYSQYFDITNSFYEHVIDKYTFLVELELLDHDFKNDFSIYKIADRYRKLIPAIPSIKMNFSVHSNEASELYCLQGAPADNLGRMLNRANIEGYIDQFSNLGNFNGKAFFFEGFRYLIKGYFRFGSSGAPYVFYDSQTKEYVVNAIQSEACPQQLLIGNSRDGHAQYINAIAMPLANVKHLVEKTKI